MWVTNYKLTRLSIHYLYYFGKLVWFSQKVNYIFSYIVKIYITHILSCINIIDK